MHIHVRVNYTFGTEILFDYWYHIYVCNNVGMVDGALHVTVLDHSVTSNEAQGTVLEDCVFRIFATFNNLLNKCSIVK